MPFIGAILPGGTIALLVGSLSAKDFINPLFAVLLIATGTFVGDMLGFLIGKKYRHTSFFKKVVFNEKHQKSWDLFDRHLAIVVIFGKLLPVVRSMPSLFAAARGTVIKKYILYSLAGSFLWAFAGIYGGKILTAILGESSIVIILFLLVLSGLAFVFKKAKAK
jgi:membrane-associated protein